MRKTLFLLGIILFHNSLMAQLLTTPEAAREANSFLWEQFPGISGLTISDTLVSKKNGITVYYTFILKEKGFVIVSAMHTTSPVLAYSTEDLFSKDNIPENAAYWLEQYATQVYNSIISQTSSNNRKNDIQTTIKTKAPLNAVSPLCTTKWDQGCFYNEFCPSDILGVCSHAVTGCVATAMAQIMKFWNYPPLGQDTHSYVHPIYGSLFADFGTTNYQWAAMDDSVISSNPAVALLMSHCGIAVNMEYGPSSSGSYITPYPFTQYFRYSKNAAYIYSYNYDSAAWVQRLKKELDGGRPILYAGMPHPPMPAGHAWVCDGYDDNDFFHFNWGWSGTFNGYFKMGNFVYSLQNSAVVNILPVQDCDITIKSLLNPVTSTFTGPEPIRVKVANYDTVPHTQVPIHYSVDNGPVISDIITDTIAPLSETIFEFSQPFNFSGQPGHTYALKVYSSLSCDAFRENDTMTFAIENVECSIPAYSMGFETNEPFAGWSIADENQDGYTWHIGSMGGHTGPYCAYTTSGSEQADDWLVSKCISLLAGKMYRLTFWYNTIGQFWPQNFDVYLGNSNATSSLTNLLTNYTGVTNTSYQEAEAWLTVPVSGSYYIGWHCYSESEMLALVIDDINIQEINATDVGLSNHIAPADGCDLQWEQLTVEVKNYCSTPLSNIPVHYSVNAGPLQTDTVPGPIAVGTSAIFTFDVPINFSLPGTYNIKVFTSLSGDTIYYHDTLTFTVTNHLSLVLPFTMGFENNEDYSEWSIEDVNTDGVTWGVIPSGGHYGPACAQYSYSSWVAAEDWIITKCIQLSPWHVYKLGFWHKIEDPTWPENLAVFIGNSSFSSSMDTLLTDLPGLTNTFYEHTLVYFTVPDEAYYYIGWKCYSDALMFNLYLDDISLEEFSTGIQVEESENCIRIYPNPGNGRYRIDNLSNSDSILEVYDARGVLLLKQQSLSTSVEIDLTGESAGLYFLKMTSSKGSRVFKLIKTQ